MSWTAPELTRHEPPTVAEERPMLEAWLDYHRATLQLKCAGLSGEQLARRAVEPSNLSLLGLVRHMAEVERSWFRRRFAGQDLGMIYCSPEREDGDFDDVEAADAELDFTTYAREVDAAREVAERHSLDDTFLHQRDKVEMDLRWIYVHMIEEYARHNGHADLLRECIDGATGE